ncbi:MAG: DNA repair protein RecO, partial [Planctomycetota bacterium]
MEERSYGLVIRVVDYSETSKIVSFFTPDFGLLQTIAKGAKRDKNPFQHALDLLSYGELLFVPKKKGLNLLTHFYLEERFSRFRESLEAYCGGCYILEGLRYSLRENQESSLFFSQSLSILEEI